MTLLILTTQLFNRFFITCCLLPNIFFGNSWEVLQCFSCRGLSRTIFGRLKCVIFGRLKYVILWILQYFSFREIEMCHSQEIEMCHFREIEICHFRDIKILQLSGDWIVSFSEIEICYFWDTVRLHFSGDWNLSFREIKLAIFERLKCSFFGELNVTFSGNWNVTFSGNEKIELFCFWKTESFIFFSRNHAHKKNWKPKTKSESKHTWGTPNVDRICHEIQPASWLLNKQFVKVKSRNLANWFEKHFPSDKNFVSVTVS